MRLRIAAVLALALALAMGAASALAESRVSQERLDRIMSAWPADVRSSAERLVAQYGLPDRVTSTILVWDVPNGQQQQAMIRAAGERASVSEAGAQQISLTGN